MRQDDGNNIKAAFSLMITVIGIAHAEADGPDY
jgi:hypothetical protein